MINENFVFQNLGGLRQSRDFNFKIFDSYLIMNLMIYSKFRNPNFSESIGIKFEFNQLLYDETFIETLLKMPFVFLQNLEFRQFLGPYHKQSKMQSDSTMTLMSKSQTK